MTPGIDLKKFKHLLIERQRSLSDIKDEGETSAETVELDQARVGRLTRMDALQSQAMHQESNRRRDLELTRIDTALQRIENKEYGYCLDCGENIAEKRLEFDPSVTLCIHCASTAETK